MKKSLLLSIVMTLVLVVAMSTATFAWYTSQASVSTTATTLVAASSTSSSLAIDEAAAPNGTNTSVTLTLSGDVLPMAPAAAINLTTPAAMPALYGADVNNAGNFLNDGEVKNPAVIQTVKGSSQEAKTQAFFYVTNTHDSQATGINATVTVTDSNAANMVIAIMVEDKVVAIWSETGKYSAGAITAGNPGAGLSDVTCTTSGTAVNIAATVAGDAGIKVSVAAWFDGESLLSAEAGNTGTFTIAFEAVAAA